ncbi:MAG: hypothetical protein R3C56_12395 [Pirellulaceae bacterium]
MAKEADGVGRGSTLLGQRTLPRARRFMWVTRLAHLADEAQGI